MVRWSPLDRVSGGGGEVSLTSGGGEGAVAYLGISSGGGGVSVRSEIY